jgi:hypothetical protein
MSTVSAPMKTFTVRCRYHEDVEYTFKNLQRIKNDALFQVTMLPQPEMLRLYEEVERQIKIQKEFCLKVGARQLHRAWMPIPIDALTVDEEWCRNKRCDYSHVAEMVAFPVEKAEGAPIITFRKEIDALGNVTVYARIADAVHRAVASLEKDDKVLMCLATTVDTVAEEALIYSTCNYHRRAHAHIDQIKARKASQDEKVTDFFKIAEARGLKIATSSQGRAAYPVIKAVSAVESIYDKYGPAVLDRTFQLITNTSPSWQCVEALQTDTLQGIALFVVTFEIPGFVNTSVVDQMFNDFTPNIIADTRATKMAVESAFHMLLVSDVSQNFRHMSVATTLLEQYTNKIKRMSRDKLPGVSQLKSLLSLWHENKLSQYKHDQVVRLRNKLEDIAETDYTHEWITPAADSGFFPSHIKSGRAITR